MVVDVKVIEQLFRARQERVDGIIIDEFGEDKVAEGMVSRKRRERALVAAKAAWVRAGSEGVYAAWKSGRIAPAYRQ